jgi:hypothetical protein
MHIHANKIEVESTENSRPVVEKFNLRSFSYCLKNKLMVIQLRESLPFMKLQLASNITRTK